MCLNYVYVLGCVLTFACNIVPVVPGLYVCVCDPQQSVQSLPTVSHLWLKLKNNPAQEFPVQLGLVVSLPESLCVLVWKEENKKRKRRLNTEPGFCFSVEQIQPEVK